MPRQDKKEKLPFLEMMLKTIAMCRYVRLSDIFLDICGSCNIFNNVW